MLVMMCKHLHDVPQFILTFDRASVAAGVAAGTCCRSLCVCVCVKMIFVSEKERERERYSETERVRERNVKKIKKNICIKNELFV